jgi:hypothetical protein
MAWLIKPDGSLTEIKPGGRGKKFTLEEMQKAVAGYIEGVYVIFEGKKRRAYVNEEGHLKGLPFNDLATRILSPEYLGNIIVGNMLVVLPGEGA